MRVKALFLPVMAFKEWMRASWMVNRALLVPFVASAPLNPIKAAKLIMEQTPHVMLYGKDAEALAEEHQLDMKDPKWFHTQYRWDQLQRAIAANALI